MSDDSCDRPIASEEDIIREFLRPLAKGCKAALDLRDDAACLTPEPGMDLVITKDALVEGVHFLSVDPPFSIGVKCVAVNLSDLVAKGARADAYFLALALPDHPSRDWLQAFSDGLSVHAGGKLAGGDLVHTDGPMVISVTAIGRVPRGTMVRRTTAKPGDRVYVSRYIGRSAAGLAIQNDGMNDVRQKLGNEDVRFLIECYRRPQPPVYLTEIIRRHASASMDISDGLVIDAGRMARGSGVCIEIEASAVPVDPVVQRMVDAGGLTLADILTGGDDYEALVSVPLERSGEFEAEANAERSGCVTLIGHVTDAPTDLVVRDETGAPMVFERTGHDHF